MRARATAAGYWTRERGRCTPFAGRSWVGGKVARPAKLPGVARDEQVPLAAGDLPHAEAGHDADDGGATPAPGPEIRGTT